MPKKSDLGNFIVSDVEETPTSFTKRKLTRREREEDITFGEEIEQVLIPVYKDKWYQNMFVHDAIIHPVIGVMRVVGIIIPIFRPMMERKAEELHDATLPMQMYVDQNWNDRKS